MASRLLMRVLLPMVLPAAMCAAQAYTPLPPPLTVNPCTTAPNPNIPQDPTTKEKPPVCPPPAPPAPARATPATPDADKPAAEKFPYPGNAPAAQQPSAAEQFPYPGEAPKQPAANAPSAPADGNSAADKFPYPGESKDASGNTPADSSSSSSSSSDSSSSSSSSSSDDTPDNVPDTDGRRHKLPKVSAQTPDERVTEDLRVARFYSDGGNYQAAYLRSKDAIETLPNDAESHFRLAQAAQNLHRKDEAVAEYNKYLQLDPGGDWSKQAKRALADLR